LKVAYLPNFNVTLGERIYPAANLSEQISLAGKEASGTGNMKFALNGAVTIGTLDGANIEIRARVGNDNFFLFGLTTEDVFRLKASGYRPGDEIQRNAELRQVLERIASGYFAGGDASVFSPLVQSLVQRDEYLLLADYHSYVEAYERVMAAYGDSERWARMSILNTARCGFFSSDRTIRQYATEIWGVKPLQFKD
jgi:glycogen phosphorylase